MVARKRKATFASKMGKDYKAAFNKHKTDETTYSTGGNLPSGIDNGIAQLTEIKFGTYDSGNFKGEWYFLAAGTVVSPDSSKDGQLIKGLRTQIMEPMCETEGRSRETVDEHVEWVLNMFRILGMETEELEPEDLEEAAKELVEAAPYFAFRTWSGKPTKQYPDPIVNHQWIKEVEYEAEEDDDVEEEDDEELEEDELEEEEYEDEEEEEEDEIDLDALVKKAKRKNKAAQKELTEWALEQGLTEEQIEETDSWEELVELAQGDEEEDEEEEEYEDDEEEEYEDEEEDEEEEDEEIPQKGMTVSYKPPRARKAVECLVTSVASTKGTCSLKNLSTKEIYKAVPFEKVIMDDIPF